MSFGLWEKETRPYEALCSAVEHSIAEAYGSDEINAHDFTAAIFDHRSGKLALTTWPMATASFFEDPTEGDLLWAEEQQIWVDVAEEKFCAFLSEQKDIEETVPHDGQPFAGYETYLFDSAEHLISTINEYRIENKIAPLEPHELLDALLKEQQKGRGA